MKNKNPVQLELQLVGGSVPVFHSTVIPCPDIPCPDNVCEDVWRSWLSMITFYYGVSEINNQLILAKQESARANVFLNTLLTE